MHYFSQESLSRLLLFSKLRAELQRKIVTEMHERTVQAGEILINEGDTGLAASALYVVKSGKFEVLVVVDMGSHGDNALTLCLAGASKASGSECPGQYEGAGRLLWRDISHVRLPQERHSGGYCRCSSLGHGSCSVQVGLKQCHPPCTPHAMIHLHRLAGILCVNSRRPRSLRWSSSSTRCQSLHHSRETSA